MSVSVVVTMATTVTKALSKLESMETKTRPDDKSKKNNNNTEIMTIVFHKF